MPPVASITEMTTTNQLRRDSARLFHAKASTLGTGTFREHEFHWTLESYPAGYEYRALEPDYCDSEDLAKGSALFSGKEHDILEEGVFGVAIMLGDLVPGNYTLRLTVKDGAIPFESSFVDLPFTVLDPAATTPPETEVEVRADGTADYTTIEAAIVANVNTENLRIIITEPGVYAEPTTEVNADGYQLVATVPGVSLDAEGRVMKCQHQGTRENWIGKGFKRINTSGNPGAPVGIDPGFPAQPRIGFALVDIELEGANAGDFCSGTFAAGTVGGLIRCNSESIDPSYGLCIWTADDQGVEAPFFAIGCRSPKVQGERGLRIKNGISNVVLSRIEGEDTDQSRANKESVRYWGGNSDWHTMDRCACPGGIIGGLNTENGIGENIRITNTYAKRTLGNGDETTAGAIGFPNFEGAGVVCCVMENELGNGGFYTPSDEGSLLAMCMIIHRRIDNLNVIKHDQSGLFTMHGNIVVAPDIVVPIAGFGSSRDSVVMDAGTSFESEGNTFPPRSLTDNNNMKINGAYVSEANWIADASTNNDVIAAQAIDETSFIAVNPDTTTVPAGVFRDLYGNPLVPGTAGVLRGPTQSVPPATAPDLRVTDASDAVIDHNDELAIPGDLAIDSTQQVQLTLHNDGDDDLEITSTSANGDLTIDAGDDPEGSTIAPAGSATITVTLSTASEGSKIGVLSIVSNDENSPFQVAVSGTVVAQPASLSVTDEDDNDVTLNAIIDAGSELLEDDTASVQLTLSNDGELALDIGEIHATNDLEIDDADDPTDTSVAGGSSTTITLLLDTSAAGAKFGSVVIETNDANSPLAFSIKGTVLLSDPNIGDGPGPDLVQRYLSVEETNALVELHLLPSDIEREAYESLTNAADRTVCAVSAADDIDAVLWDGRRLSETQPAQFPRSDRLHGLILPGGEADVPSSLGQSSWTVASIPREIRIAVAIQAAYRAAISLGVVPAPAHSSRPFDRLHPKAQTFTRRYRRKAASFV